MFFKLLKYDFKAVIKKLGIFYIGVLILALFGRLINVIFTNDVVYSMVYNIDMLILAIFPLTLIFTCVRYYKNMLSDEAYLTHTLPVSTAQIYISKILNIFVFEVISIILFLIAGIISTPGFLDFIKNMIISIFDILGEINTNRFANLAIALVFYGINYGIFTIIVITTCLSIGSIYNKNKLLHSFAAYIIFKIICSILNVIVIIISIVALKGMEENINWGAFFWVYSVILIIINCGLFVLSLWLTKHKLNLE